LTGVVALHKDLSGRQEMGGFVSKATSGDDNCDDSLEVPYLIVGLGNPGLKYKNNRHNVGFMAVDAIGAAHDISFGRLQKNCHVGRGYIHDKKVLLAKPMTFMNNSGEGVSKLLKFYRIPLDKLIVLTDDLDTAPGKVRLKQKGGHGGQNGLRSIIDLVKSKDFARVKIGIGRPGPGDDVVTHVLSDFSHADDAQNELRAQLKETVDIVEAVISLGMDKALSGVRISTAPNQDSTKRKRDESQDESGHNVQQKVLAANNTT
jgi:peptidyl-tRNA hydrolase, PTH1 family